MKIDVSFFNFSGGSTTTEGILSKDFFCFSAASWSAAAFEDEEPFFGEASFSFFFFQGEKLSFSGFSSSKVVGRFGTKSFVFLKSCNSQRW